MELTKLIIKLCSWAVIGIALSTTELKHTDAKLVFKEVLREFGKLSILSLLFQRVRRNNNKLIKNAMNKCVGNVMCGNSVFLFYNSWIVCICEGSDEHLERVFYSWISRKLWTNCFKNSVLNQQINPLGNKKKGPFIYEWLFKK